MEQITLKQITAANEVFIMLNNLRRWTDFTTQQKYNELAKQAFNCIIAYVLAKTAEHAGKTICYEHFPRIVLGRAFAKVYVYYDTPEHKIQEICDLSGISKREFDKVTSEIIAEKTDKEFADFLSKGIGRYEMQIYKAATKIATYIELLEQQKSLIEMSKIQEIERTLRVYDNIPGVKEFSDTNSAIFKMFQKLSNLRNQNRWATSSYNVECSVLGHSFDTAVFAYLIALTESRFDEGYATKMFFMGIFHDIAETWTKDIPAPIKDRIEGFRTATEQYEKKMLEKHIYSIVPSYMEDALKDIMLEDESNASFKKKLKEADYLSADSECYRNLIGGSRDPYFCEVIINRKINRDASAIYRKVHKFFKAYAKKVYKVFAAYIIRQKILRVFRGIRQKISRVFRGIREKS